MICIICIFCILHFDDMYMYMWSMQNDDLTGVLLKKDKAIGTATW